MRILFLYNPNISNHYVINQIIKKNGIFKIAEIQPTSNALKRVIRRKQDTIFSKIDKIFFFSYFFIFIRHKLEKYLIRQFKECEQVIPDLIVKDINQPHAVEYARSMDPDIILVLGTSILRDDWLIIGKPIINAHTGIMPEYRGRFCWFWPIYKKDFNNIGVTIHHIAQRADSGSEITKYYLDLRKIGQINIYSILAALPDLILKGFQYTIKAFSEGKLSLSDQKIKKEVFPIYLEPGLSHFIKFRRIIKKHFPN